MPFATDDLVRRKARVLSGFMGQSDAMGFATGGMVIDQQNFVAAWQAQQSKLAQPLPASFVPPQTASLTPAAAARVSSLQTDPALAKFYANATFEMVELGKLIACQWWVDMDVSGGVHGAGAGAAFSDAEVSEKCLPMPIMPGVQVFHLPQGANGITLYSTNNTFTVVGPNVTPNGQVMFAVGAGANLMMVREHGGRYVLANGYHRACLLRSKGVSMVPVAVIRVATPSEMVLGPGSVSEATIFSSRPPIVDDFTDPTLALEVEIRATLVAVKITAERSLVPRLLF